MNSRILSIMRKEFIQIRRDPRTLGIMMLLPAFQIFLLGYVVTTNVNHIATVVFDQAKDSAEPELRPIVRQYRVLHAGGPDREQRRGQSCHR